MNRYNDYQIRSMAEGQCEKVIKNAREKEEYMRGYFPDRDSDPKSLEKQVKSDVTRDSYIYRNVLSPESDFTIDELDAILFIMCSIFQNQYALDISYRQILKESHFEDDWEKEDFGSIPYYLRKNGWDRDKDPDKLMRQFSRKTNFDPTYARISHLIDCMVDDELAEADAELDRYLEK